jgi:hypothetical protein
MSTSNDWCRYCGRMRSVHCRSTRDMEDNPADEMCQAALMELGGGEYRHNQEKAAALKATTR